MLEKIKEMKESHTFSLLDGSDVAVYGDEFLSKGFALFALGGRLKLPRAAQRRRGSFDWVVWPESGRNELDSSRGDAHMLDCNSWQPV